MAKSTGSGIADQFKRGDRKLAAAIDAAIATARAEEARALQQRLAAAIVEYGTRRSPGPYRLIVSRRSINAVTPEGVVSETDLPGGRGRLLSYSPQAVTPRITR